MKKIFLVALFASLLALPLMPHAVHAADVTLYNPLGSDSSSSDVRIILGRVIKGFISIMGSLALLMFIYGGMFWLTSAGNAERIKKGKDIILWSTMGLIIVFASYAIVNALINGLTVGSVTGT